METNAKKRSLTDLHTHILPGIDDGARDLDSATRLLLAEKAGGVERVALTPHFYPLRQEMDRFLEKRQNAYEQLQLVWDEETMPQLRLGAEVRYSPCLTDMDVGKLTLESTNHLLLELSDTTLPALIEPVLQNILDQGITPILAHVERCVYFLEQPAKLTQLIEMGALAQISLRRFPSKKTKSFAEICLQKNIAQIIASDIHEPEEGAMGDLQKKLAEETVIRAETFARAVWDNTQLPAFEPIPVRRKLFGYT